MRSAPPKFPKTLLRGCNENLIEFGDIPQLARLFGALAEPTRLKLLLAINAAGRLGATECVKASGLSQGRTSVHLSCLAGCGLIAVERVGRRKYYRIADPAIPDILQLARLHVQAATTTINECQSAQPTAS